MPEGRLRSRSWPRSDKLDMVQNRSEAVSNMKTKDMKPAMLIKRRVWNQKAQPTQHAIHHQGSNNALFI